MAPSLRDAATEVRQTQLKQRLLRARLRPTRARLAVLALLDTPSQLPSDAEALYHALDMQDRHASLGTVYRILKEFERTRLAMREFDSQGRALYMSHPEDAPVYVVHVACRDTGETFRLVDDTLHAYMEKLLAGHGWQLDDMPLTIHLSARRVARGLAAKAEPVVA